MGWSIIIIFIIAINLIILMMCIKKLIIFNAWVGL
jgi:hypothetical protein